MRGMSEIGHRPGMRRLPRPGWTGGAPEFVSVPGLPGRRSRAGSGPWGTADRACAGWGVGTSVPCKVTVRQLLGRTASPRVCAALRPAACSYQAPPQGATCGVQPHRIEALPSALVGVQPTTAPGAPSRGAGKAAASSRHALQPRRESVVTGAKRTVKRSERASDDAVRRNLHAEETRSVRAFSRFGDRGPKSAGKCRKVKTQFVFASQKKL